MDYDHVQAFIRDVDTQTFNLIEDEMNQADKQEIRANLLFAFAPALAEAIAQNHWKAVEIAKAYQAAIDVLVTPSSTVYCEEEAQPEQDAPANLVTWQQRVIVEAAELVNKIAFLRTFRRSIVHSELSQLEQHTLEKQESLMRSYLGVLEHRIARFVNEV